MKSKKRFLPEFVYGSIDGTITTFAVVSGVMGASLSSVVVLIMGFANLLADGFSMAVSNYLSVKSSLELNHKKKAPKEPISTGIATFCSFFSVGLIPLIPFLFSFAVPIFKHHEFTFSIILTGVALFGIGFIKGEVIKKHPIMSGIQTLIIGGIASSLAFLVGYLLKSVIN